MNRVLSMDMQSRGCSGQSVYVTKRLCISIVFTVGFLCILGGYLIGHISSEPKNKNNRNQSNNNKDLKDVLTDISTQIDEIMKATANGTLSVLDVKELKEKLDETFQEQERYNVVNINDFNANLYVKEIISSKLNVLLASIHDALSIVSNIANKGLS